MSKGMKTSELALSAAAAIVATLVGSGVIPMTSTAGQVATIVGLILGALGYTAGRSSVKKAEANLKAADASLDGIDWDSPEWEKYSAVRALQKIAHSKHASDEDRKAANRKIAALYE